MTEVTVSKALLERVLMYVAPDGQQNEVADEIRAAISASVD